MSLAGAGPDYTMRRAADDFVAVCGSLEEAQAVAATVYAYSCKWRFQLNSAKSAIMHVASGNTASHLVKSGIVWNGVPVPAVREYCYLGLWFNNKCTWDTHCERTLQKAQRVMAKFMPIWKSRDIGVAVKRIVLLSCIRPVIEFGAEVWYAPSKSYDDKIDKVQLDIIKCSMRCSKEHPCSEGLLAEWGVKPLHMWMHQRMMEFHFRVQRMPMSRLPKQVFSAEWQRPGGALLLTGWQKKVQSLLCKYGVNVDVAADRASACKAHIRKQIAALHADCVVRAASSKATLERYTTHVHPNHVASMRFKAARPYLRSGVPTRGIELMLRIRLSCLCVHARTRKYGGNRANGTAPCPACGAANETLEHLVLHCPATSSLRNSMFDEIRSLPGCAEKLRSILSESDSSAQVLHCVSDGVWGRAGVGMLASRLIADFVLQAWDHRNACKHTGAVLPPPTAPEGRGADGVVAMA